jgi:16S rRNA (guanine527-N7)-methyltransferase
VENQGAQVDHPTLEQLAHGVHALGLTLPADALERLAAWADELLRWNEKLNLTAITRPLEVVDKHLLDSLAVLPEVEGATRLLDLGAGAGLPGLPLAVALPTLRATLVDAVAKKVGFLKAAAVKAGVADRVKAVHLRARGDPKAEHLAPADLVISRAFMDVGPFVALAAHYVEPGGRVVAMLGQAPSEAELARLGEAAGLRFTSLRRLTLPLSGDPRGVAVFQA